MINPERLELRRKVLAAHTTYQQVWEKCCEPNQNIDQRLVANWTNAADYLTATLHDLRAYLLREPTSPDVEDELTRTERTLALIVKEGDIVHRAAHEGSWITDSAKSAN